MRTCPSIIPSSNQGISSFAHDTVKLNTNAIHQVPNALPRSKQPYSKAHTMVPSPSSLVLADATTSRHFKRSQKIAWAYGLTAGMGILVVGSLFGALLCLRRRHKRRKAAGLIRATQEDARLYCVCLMCSGCKKQRGGGKEGQPCPRCKQQCEGN